MEYKLSTYALSPENSRGRLYVEKISATRNAFQRDLNRITHSAPFRRLEYKTQVFANDKGDHYRTRLTHSLEVSQVGRVIASTLGLSTELTEVICLSHDLGHPPFGHAGEEVLNNIMSKYGGFDHNANTLKLITEQEEKYFGFDGLNLTWESLEGIVKHNGPLVGVHSSGKKIPKAIIDFNKKFNLELDKFASLEAQVAAIADDIAYNAHDLEDGLRAGLFSINDLVKESFMRDIMSGLDQSNHPPQRVMHEITRRVTNLMVEDVIKTSREKISAHKIKTFSDVQNAPETIIQFSKQNIPFVRSLRKFLFKNMYQHSQVNRMVYKAKKIISDLFVIYLENPGCLPEKWQNKIDADRSNTYEVVSDYIAGMTDRFAMREHEQLYNF